MQIFLLNLPIDWIPVRGRVKKIFFLNINFFFFFWNFPEIVPALFEIYPNLLMEIQTSMAAPPNLEFTPQGKKNFQIFFSSTKKKKKFQIWFIPLLSIWQLLLFNQMALWHLFLLYKQTLMEPFPYERKKKKKFRKNKIFLAQFCFARHHSWGCGWNYKQFDSHP